MTGLPWHQQALRELLARRERMPHAVLLTGREGFGKVEFARALAQSMLCEQPAAGGLACGACPACGWFGEGNHPDYREVLPDNLVEDEPDAEAVATDAKPEKKSAAITVDQIRALQQFITLSTHRAGWRVLVLHPAEAMNPQAANALLKTLEEPTPHTLMLLVTDQAGRLMPTVRSRCQVVTVPGCEPSAAEAWLVEQGLSGRVAQDVLAQAGGAPLLALAWADEAWQDSRRQVLTALAEPERADWLQLAGALEKTDLKPILHWVHTWCCDLVLQQQTGGVRHHPDFAKAAAKLADRASALALFRFESELRQLRRHIQHPLNARLWLEHLLLSYSLVVAPADAGRD
ncbi:MAG: DNA polymerase III subunit delta' [Betaproteobacteria bacterium]|nr:DNA polymerase III subunit delta' [Betaproteobacteria bacterium]